MRINICLSCDDNYVKYAGVAIASILANANEDDELYIYILDGKIKTDSKNKILALKNIKNCSIEFIPINEKEFEDYKKVKNHSYISISTYYRLKLATLLPNIDKILYLDCDIIVNSSLSELFLSELENYIFAGVKDIDIAIRNNSNYVNAGVLLMDLNKVRKNNIQEKFYSFAKENYNKIELGDQGIINEVLKGQIKIVDDKYNVQSECFIRRSSFTKNPAIVHFVGLKKPWVIGSWSHHKKLYFKYLELTPWKLNFQEKLYYEVWNNIVSFYTWYKHKPFFFLEKKFWNAVYLTNSEGK